LRWSEQPIVWSCEDHPPRVDNPGQLALVVAPQVGGYKLLKVLMDGASSINILYYDTFRRMNLTNKDLKPSSTIFHGWYLVSGHILLERLPWKWLLAMTMTTEQRRYGLSG